MGNTRNTGYLQNAIKVSDAGAITFVSGSTILATLSTTGQLSGSIPVLFAATSSFANAFTVAGNLTAQTLVVQTITSSIVYSSGSNIFGNNIANTQVMTGSVTVTGSLAVVTNGTEFQVTSTGVNLGNALTDSHVISGSLRVNPNGLFVSGSGVVGIGTNNPTEGTQAAGSISIIPVSSVSSAPLIQFPGNGRIRPASNGDRLSIDGNSLFLNSTFGGNVVMATGGGNVGIGTSSPTQGKLVISNAGPSVIALRETSVGVNSYWNASDGSVTFFGNESNHPLGFVTNGSERMRITSGGNVGIGTTGPATTLTVYKTRLASFTTQTPNNLYLQSQGYDGSGFNTIDFGSTSYGVPLARIGVGIFGDGAYMAFGTSNSYATGITNTAVTINPTGNVGIGTGISGSPNNRLLVQGGNLAKGTTFGFDGVVDNMIKFGAQQDLNASGQFLDRWLGIDCTVTAGAAASNIMFFKVYSGGGSGSPITAAYFNGLGNVFNFNNSTTWQQSSDIRIKENIRPINNALEKLCALNPSHFEYKNNLGKTKTGFIAQEFEQVFAGHVTENVPSGDFKQYFEEGEMIKSIDADLIPYLTKAIQELKAENDTLKEILQRNNIQ